MHDVFVELWAEPGVFEPEVESSRSYLLAQTYRMAAEIGGAESLEEGVSGEFVRVQTRWARRSRRGPRVPPSGGGDSTSKRSAPSIEQRETIELALFPGTSYRDIALFLGESDAWVKADRRAGLRSGGLGGAKEGRGS